ncbi:MAG: hypothetical protein EWM45_03895 [Rhodopseudomonas palustris]|nr:MAG: hypothetical protein EWM45_03895 [Rhodopseudomonas palustris]
MRLNPGPHRVLLLLAVGAPLLGGCAGSDMFSSDLLSRDAEWFSRAGRSFVKNVSIETPPLSPDKPVRPDDLISADGACPGMTPPGTEATGSADAPASSGMGAVALGHTECDVARGLGTPNNVNLSSNERGDRIAVLTYNTGPRAGIYTFKAGRLSEVERAPQAETPTAGRRPKKRTAG